MSTSLFRIFYLSLLCVIEAECSRSPTNQALQYIQKMAANRRNRNTRSVQRSPYSITPYTLSSRPAPCPQRTRNNSVKSEGFIRCMNRSAIQNNSINRLRTLFNEMLYKHKHALTHGHHHFIEMCYQEQNPPSPLSKVIRPVYKDKTSPAHNRSVRFVLTPNTKEFIEGWGDNSSINILYPGEPPVSHMT